MLLDRLNDLIGVRYANGVSLILDAFLTAPQRRSLALAMNGDCIFTVRFVLDPEGLTMGEVLDLRSEITGAFLVMLACRKAGGQGQKVREE